MTSSTAPHTVDNQYRPRPLNLLAHYAIPWAVAGYLHSVLYLLPASGLTWPHSDAAGPITAAKIAAVARPPSAPPRDSPSAALSSMSLGGRPPSLKMRLRRCVVAWADPGVELISEPVGRPDPFEPSATRESSIPISCFVTSSCASAACIYTRTNAATSPSTCLYWLTCPQP